MTIPKLYQIVSVCLGACAFIYSVLALAQVGLLEKGCKIDFTWFGCVLRSHENLAGGLVGGAMTLAAAWIAWMAVQVQIQADNIARTEDRRTAEQLLIERLDGYAEGLAEAWQMIVDLRSQRPPSIHEVRKAVAEVIKVVTEPIAIAAYREMVMSLGWEKRLDFGHLLDEIELLRPHISAESLGDCSDVEGSLRRISHFFESCIPDAHEYFKELPQGSPKAWSIGTFAKHVAGLDH